MVEITALLIGEEDTVHDAAPILQESLLKFGRATIMTSDLSHAATHLNSYCFHLVVFHLGSTPSSAEAETLKLIRTKSSQNVDKMISILIIPELYAEDVSSDTAEFILMEPLSQDKLARVLIDCQFLTRGQSDSDVTPVSYAEPVQRGLELPSFQGGLVSSVFKSSEWPDTGMVCGSQPSFSEEITCMSEALLHSRKEHTRRLQIKECCDRLRALLPNIKDNWIDTASVLEMTVEYMRYLQNKVPEEVLSQVAKLMGENRTGRWWKQTKTPLQPTKPQLKGKERNIKKSKCKKDKNPKAGRFKAKKPKADYLAANSLGRCILPAVDRSSKLRPTGQPAAPAVIIPDSNPNSAEVLFQDFPAQQYPEGINVTFESFCTTANVPIPVPGKEHLPLFPNPGPCLQYTAFNPTLLPNPGPCLQYTAFNPPLLPNPGPCLQYTSFRPRHIPTGCLESSHACGPPMLYSQEPLFGGAWLPSLSCAGRSSPAGSNCHLPEENTHFCVLEQCYSGNPVCTELSRSAQGTEFKWHSSITEVGEMTSGVPLHSCPIEDV
ncbi:uncharacterized protein LOC117972746 [Acipenser ruthenus]|uniref:uncharacterized protein LOC117972746 n=1 Tax=Acipenser ruthenus TaxID=7906 RepID=UPI00274140DB|nr:uncharacterized protein LOC117972746 [Acipenser ruthenus]